MPDGGEPVSIKVAARISEVDAAQWDSCAEKDNPFVSHVFLDALEESGAVLADTGWLPQHVLVEDEAGRLAGCVPCYMKNNSYGEYVFDWGWAEAFERAGGTYYPKLLAAVPFTPVNGPRLLVRSGPNADHTRSILIAGLMELAKQREVSSLHITFPTKKEHDLLGNCDFLQRTGKQFHWHNRGYTCFDDFLDALNSRKRKAIRKERRDANRDLTIETLTGDDMRNLFS